MIIDKTLQLFNNYFLSFEKDREDYNSEYYSFENSFENNFYFSASEPNPQSNNVKLQAVNSYKHHSLYSLELNYDENNNLTEKDGFSFIYLSKESSVTSILQAIHVKREKLTDNLLASDRFYSDLRFYNKIYDKLRSLFPEKIFLEFINERTEYYKIESNMNKTEIESVEFKIAAYSKQLPSERFSIIFDKDLNVKMAKVGLKEISLDSEDDIIKFIIANYIPFKDSNILDNICFEEVSESNYKEVFGLIKMLYY